MSLKTAYLTLLTALINGRGSNLDFIFDCYNVVVFVSMAASVLLFRRYRNNQVLGTTLSKTHARHPEVKKVLGSFARACYVVLIVSMPLSLLSLTPIMRPYAEFYMLLLVVINLFVSWLMVERHKKMLLQACQKKPSLYCACGAFDRRAFVHCLLAPEEKPQSCKPVYQSAAGGLIKTSALCRPISLLVDNNKALKLKFQRFFYPN